jgi:hypothetical protein
MAVCHVERGGNLGQHELRRAQCSKPNEGDTVREALRQLVCRLDRDARLARAPWAGQRDEPRLAAEELAYLPDLAPASDERRRR